MPRTRTVDPRGRYRRAAIACIRHQSQPAVTAATWNYAITPRTAHVRFVMVQFQIGVSETRATREIGQSLRFRLQLATGPSATVDVATRRLDVLQHAYGRMHVTVRTHSHPCATAGATSTAVGGGTARTREASIAPLRGKGVSVRLGPD